MDLIDDAALTATATAAAQVDLDHGEHDRRRAAGLRALTSMRELDVLLQLPHGHPVPMRSLSEHAAQVVSRLPAGAVTFDSARRCVTRLAVPPLQVVTVAVLAGGPSTLSWRAALRQACQFAPYAARVVLVDAEPASVAARSWEADVAGVGLWARHNGLTHELVAPTPFVVQRFTAAGWRFRERAYQSWLRAAHG